MQFAGQRTSMQLKPIGEPYNIIITLTDDILPDPDAILITGITPQKTKDEGITEAEFLKLFHNDIATSGTIFVGYNTVRFDDEFMRYLHYRNFYDPYEWHWQDGKSRWDLLDAVRMTRALRPDGIKWPFSSDGKPSNRLELLTGINALTHKNAHDALSDVQATIALAQLIKRKQPRLFNFLLKMRDKREVEHLVKQAEPFVYTSGKYSGETEKTTVVAYIGDNPKSGAFVYDLRHNPQDWFDKTPQQLAEAWRWKRDSDEPRLPVKTLQYNRCPAVAPLGVLDDGSKERLQLNMNVVQVNFKLLRANSDFYTKLVKAAEILNKQQQTAFLASEQLVDAQLYDGFFDSYDKTKMSAVRSAMPDDIPDIDLEFKDARLNALLPLYKARNFPQSLSEQDRHSWEAYRVHRLTAGGESSRLASYFKRLGELSQQTWLNQDQQYLLEELQLYGESIVPTGD